MNHAIDCENKIVALLSGGMDSTAMITGLLASGHSVLAISINYGQRHAKELDRALAIIKYWKDRFGDEKIEHWIIPLSSEMNSGFHHLLGSSALTGAGEIPEGHYTEESMKATVVPNRNMILISIATAMAISHDAQFVAYAAHAGDHAIYPDCRPAFVRAMAGAVEAATDGAVMLMAPFIHHTKAYIAKQGSEWGTPFEMTWSCYKGGDRHCGRCGTCVERAEAFALAEIPDPTEYDDPEFWKAAVKS